MGRLSKIAETAQLLGSTVLALLFPKSCAGCGTIDRSLDRFWCDQCLGEMAFIGSPLCPVCGRPFLDAPDSSDHLCGECLESAFHFDSARSAVLHLGIVRDRIHQLKFGGRLEWTTPLAELLLKVYHGWDAAAPDLVLPVPLHTRRLRQRGFNQSGLLARELAQNLGLPVSLDSLARKQWTEPQTRLNRHQRLKNVRGAFEVRRPELVRGRRVLLVDDVFTTGETLNECARTLKKKGAAGVYALTVTRALPD